MKNPILSITVLLSLIIGSSCSRQEQIFDSLPADITSVITVDLNKLCEAADIKLTADGEAEIPEAAAEQLQPLMEDIDLLAYLKAENIIDIEHVVAIMDYDNTTYAILQVKDSKRLTESGEGESLWSDGPKGYKTSHNNGGMYLLKDNLLWFVKDTRNPIKNIESLKERAKEIPLSRLDGVVEALERDNIANIVVRAGAFSGSNSDKALAADQLYAEEWHVGSLIKGATSNIISAGYEMINSNGVRIAPKGMQNINPALLAYVPSDFNVVLAAGLTKDFDWTPLRKLIMLTGDFQTAAAMSTVSPYLESIDGTVLIAARYGNVTDGANPYEMDGTPDFILLAHMPQSKINGLLQMMREMMANAGMSPKMSPEGYMIIPQYGKTLYIGNVDGYLGISTIGFDNTLNNSLAPVFVNKDFAASVTLQPSSLFGGEETQPSSLTLSATMDNGSGDVKLQAEGLSTSIITYLISLAD